MNSMNKIISLISLIKSLYFKENNQQSPLYESFPPDLNKQVI